MIYTNERIEMRRSQVLKAPTYERSDHFAVELRKKKRRDAIISKRVHRNENLSSEIPTDLSVEKVHCIIDQYSNLLNIYSPDIIKVSEILHQLRLFTCMSNPPFLKMVSSGIIHYLQPYVNQNVPIDLLFESTWIICNLASGESPIPSQLIENGYFDKMIDLIELNNDEIADNCIFFIGNIAADSIESCEAVLNSSFFKKIANFFTNKTQLSMKIIKTLLYTFHSISIKKLFMHAEATTVVIDFLRQIKTFINSTTMHEDWLKIICYLTSFDGSYGQLILEKHLISRIFEYLFFNSVIIQCTAIRILGNMIVSSDRFTDIFLKWNILDNFLQLIKSPYQDVKKETYWALSNITGSKIRHVNIFVEHSICELGMQGLIDDDVDIKIEASWLYTNVGRKGGAYEIGLLVNKKICEYIAEALVEKNSRIIYNLISLINFIMIAAEALERKEIYMILNKTGCYNALSTLYFTAEKQYSSRIARMLDEITKHISIE